MLAMTDLAVTGLLIAMAITIALLLRARRPLMVGSRIHLSGLRDHSALPVESGAAYGRVIAFLSGTNGQLAAIVRLDAPLVVADDVTSDVALLYLSDGRSYGWPRREAVRVEVWRDVPQI